MRYNGGKGSCARELAGIISEYRPIAYWEPFVGAANVITKVTANFRVGTDLDADIILLLRAVRDGWVPPEKVSEEEYKNAKNRDPSAIRAFFKYGCSFGGKPWEGFARSGDRNYALNAKNSLLKQAPALKGIDFIQCDYRSVNPTHFDVIYCDPPYKGTTSVGCGGKFDSDFFWEWVRQSSQHSVVLVSELQAPEDFDCIWEKPLKDGLGKKKLTEKLFKYKRR
jgi:DNA adenine methylase